MKLKNAHIIVNPKSGDGSGQKILDHFLREAASRSVACSTHRTRSEGDGVKIARELPLEGCDAMICIGGDGTLNEVVNGLLSRDRVQSAPIGILPAGTGNSLMKDLGCDGPEEAMRDIFLGKICEIDVFKMTLDDETRYGLNMVGCGFPAAVNAYAERARIFKKQRYNVGALLAWFGFKRCKCVFSVDGEEPSVYSDFLIVTNTRHIGTGIEIAPHAKLDNGYAELMYVGKCNRKILISLFRKLRRGTHVRDPNVVSRSIRTLSAHSPGTTDINMDGEQHRFTNFALEVLPRKISLLHEPVEGTASR